MNHSPVDPTPTPAPGPTPAPATHSSTPAPEGTPTPAPGAAPDIDAPGGESGAIGSEGAGSNGDHGITDHTRELIDRHEGREAHVYTDTEGHPSVGVGFNLDRPGAREALAAVGADYDAVRAGQQDLTDAQMDRLRDSDLERARQTVRDNVENFDSLSPSQQDALTDMAYNLGPTGFAGFQKMIEAVENDDWETAAAEMEDSQWAAQVGAERLNDDMDGIQDADGDS